MFPVKKPSQPIQAVTQELQKQAALCTALPGGIAAAWDGWNNAQVPLEFITEERDLSYCYMGHLAYFA